MKKVFTLLILLQLGVFLGLVYEKDSVHKKGKEYKFEVTYVDPYDFMRGNYLKITLNQKTLDQVNGKKYEDKKVYLIIEEKEELAQIVGFQMRKPKKKDYLKGKIIKTYNNRYYFEAPIKRYYVEEKKGREYERKLKAKKKVVATIRIHKGKYIVESLEI